MAARFWGITRTIPFRAVFGTTFTRCLATNPKREKLRLNTQDYMQHRGGISIFLSCGLVAPLGPYVNFVSGLTKYNWLRFAIWGALGDVFWGGIYVGLGYSFSDQIMAVGSLLGNASGLIVALLLAFMLGRWLWRARKPEATGDNPA